MSENTIIFYGSEWCSDCRRSKKLLDELKIAYEYIDIAKVEGAAEKVTEINKGFQSIPTILFPDGKILVEPTKEELLNELANLADKKLLIVHKN